MTFLSPATYYTDWASLDRSLLTWIGFRPSSYPANLGYTSTSYCNLTMWHRPRQEVQQRAGPFFAVFSCALLDEMHHLCKVPINKS